MAGNVSEWVQDCWNNDYTGAPFVTPSAVRDKLVTGGWRRWRILPVRR